MIQPIVLAAGLGTRMGAIKALLPIDGPPALAVVLRTIESAGLQSPIVVLGHDVDEIRDTVDLSGCKIVVNEHPERGLSRSVQLGLSAIEETATGVLLFHVDMPYLAPSTVRALLQAVANGAALAAPFHEGKRGFPVYFDRASISTLNESLRGDRGGRRFLADHSDDLIHVSVDDPGCIYDIDRPSDLTAWKGEPLCAINE
ncbi:NTP transferase domain-containing protein [Candidatus Bipolaricaulota bacterium]